MQTETEVANRALTILGESRIISIEDPIRPHRWTCATDRAVLSRSYPDPLFAWKYSFSRPADYIRLLEVNGERFSGSMTSFEMEGDKILTNVEVVQIRYLKTTAIRDMDSLLQAAVCAKLASILAVPLTGNASLARVAEAAYTKAVGEASRINAIEVTAGANDPMRRDYEQSMLLASRRGRIYLGSYRKP